MNEQYGDIAVVLGTRPEIIKLAPVVRSLGTRARVIHTGQHWDEGMAGQFFRDLNIGEPDVRLSGMAGGRRGLQIAAAIEELSLHFENDPPSAVIVQGDTNSTSAGAQAASYAGIPVVHVEAGLRSHDRTMPEELNRLVVCALADLHCAATESNKQNLLRENIDPERIKVTGNTVVEATKLAMQDKADIRGFDSKSSLPRVLVTIHRPENTDSRDALGRILGALHASDMNIIFALHPRTQLSIKKFGLEHYLEKMDVRTSMGHKDFLTVALDADLIVSDSGGVQEEVTVIKKPLLVIRQSTERPESVEAGFSRLVTPDEDLDLALVSALSSFQGIGNLNEKESPYGEGLAGEKIAKLTCALVDT